MRQGEVKQEMVRQGGETGGDETGGGETGDGETGGVRQEVERQGEGERGPEDEGDAANVGQQEQRVTSSPSVTSSLSEHEDSGRQTNILSSQVFS